MNTCDEMKAILRCEGRLTIDGFANEGDADFADRRDALLRQMALAEFQFATAWLRHVPKIRTGGESSYRLKHVVEDWAGEYVSNGAMIAAALALGFRVEPIEGPNALIGVACGRHWPLRPDSKAFEWVRRRYPGNRKVVAPPVFSVA